MSGLADVHGVERVTEDDGTPGVDVTIDPDSGNDADADHFGPPGDDSLPLPGVDLAAVSDGAGSGNPQVTGYTDSKNPGKAIPGDKRIVGRASDGTVVCEIWLHGDATVRCENGAGYWELKPNGEVEFNGVIVKPGGDVVAPGEVTAVAAAALVTLSKHTHPTAMGPSGTPVPGA